MFSSQPSKGPEEPAEAEDEAPAKAAGEAAGTESGKSRRKNSATPSGDQDADAEREAPAAKSRWTSNVGNWMSAWKDGGKVEVRQLDTMAKMGDNSVMMQGKLFKRGEKSGDAFRPRWITLNKKCVSYSVDETSPPIDHISFQDVVAMCYHRPRINPNAADDDTITQLDATATTADNEHAVVQQVADVTKEYQEHAAKLHVNIIFRDKVSENMMEHVEQSGLELGQCEFCLVTAVNAYQRGRIFVFRAESRERAEVWQETISRVIACYANVPVESCSTLSMCRRKVHWFYMGDRCQVTVAALILSNFILNIFEAHFTPEEGSDTQALFAQIDMGFTIIFTCELLTNMFATLVYEFVKDSWNWFDTMVVGVSLCTLFLENLPGAKPLKLMRCFRVFRLFKRIPSLRQIIVALTASVPPMINAFALVCLVTAIYAIVGVTLFSAKDPENFVDFFTAMFTMFQVMTGDNWSDICRGLFVLTGQGAGVAMFFVSFQLIVALVLVNVVIAVLLDEFSNAAEKRLSGGSNDEDGGAKCPFEKIARYLSEYKDLDDLESMINDLYDRVLAKSKLRQKMGGGLEIHAEMTPEAIRRTLRAYFICWRTGEPLAGQCDGNVTFIEFRAGIKSLGFIPPIIVTRPIWEAYVLAEASALKLNTETELLSRRGFMALMKLALKRFQLKSLTVAMEGDPDGWNKNGITSALMGVKGLLVEDLELAKGGLTVMNDKKHNRLPEEFEAKDDAERAATELLLKRLVMDMHKMHKRFDAVESELAAVRYASRSMSTLVLFY
jgi:voltage-gated sodium channel